MDLPFLGVPPQAFRGGENSPKERIHANDDCGCRNDWNYHMRALSSIRSAAELRSAPAAGRITSFTPVRPTPAHPEALAVLAAATELEPDLAEAVSWYLLAPIAELDYLTAGEPVARGRAQAVLGFLRGVIDGKRG